MFRETVKQEKTNLSNKSIIFATLLLLFVHTIFTVYNDEWKNYKKQNFTKKRLLMAYI